MILAFFGIGRATKRDGTLTYLKPGQRFQRNDLLEYDGCPRIVGSRACHFRPGDIIREIDVKLSKPRRYQGQT